MTKFLKSLISILIMASFIFTGCATDGVANDNLSSVSPSGVLEVHFLNVGQADCSLIKFSDGSNMLIDAGNNGDAKYVTEYLNNQGVKRLDVVVGTHPHEDHIGSLDTVINNFDIGTVYMPDDVATTKTFTGVIDAIENKGLSITEPVVGSTFNLGGANFTILGPQKKYDDHNNNSIVLKMVYGDTSFMFTGDAEVKAEEDIMAKGYDLKADVLKVGHHGSSTSTSDKWLSLVDPMYAVIQCEKGNDYGHPHKETIQKLNAKGIEIFRNDELGEIVITTDGKNITVKSGESILSEAESAGTSLTVNQETNDKNTSTSTETTYIGNTSSKKFHRDICESLPNENNRVYFSSRDEAISKGYTPCGNCNP